MMAKMGLHRGLEIDNHNDATKLCFGNSLHYPCCANQSSERKRHYGSGAAGRDSTEDKSECRTTNAMSDNGTSHMQQDLPTIGWVLHEPSSFKIDIPRSFQR
jgi:hypothetical protein